MAAKLKPRRAIPLRQGEHLATLLWSIWDLWRLGSKVTFLKLIWRWGKVRQNTLNKVMWVSNKIGVTVKMPHCRQVSCQCSNLMQRWDEQNTCPLVLDCCFSLRDLVVNLAVDNLEKSTCQDGKSMKIHHEIRCVLLEKGWLPVPSLLDRRVSAGSFASGFLGLFVDAHVLSGLPAVQTFQHMLRWARLHVNIREFHVIICTYLFHPGWSSPFMVSWDYTQVLRVARASLCNSFGKGCSEEQVDGLVATAIWSMATMAKSELRIDDADGAAYTLEDFIETWLDLGQHLQNVWVMHTCCGCPFGYFI